MKPNKSQLADVPPAQRKRKARIQPHTAIGVAVSCLAAGAFVAYAATGGSFSFAKSSIKSPVPMKSTLNSHNTANKAIENSGAKAQLLGQTKTTGAKKGGFLLTQAGANAGLVSSRSLVSTGKSGNNLSEFDLTANTASDERDAAFSPNGQYVAFRSNGIDANGDGKLDANGFSADGKYHIWVGKFQTQTQVGGSPTLEVYQVTGQNTQYLKGFDQYRPTWSTNSRELAFVSNSSINGGSASGEQIYRIDLNLQNSGVPQPAQPYNLTSFPGPKRSPVWSLNGTEIVFAAKSQLTRTGISSSGNSYDLFRISSNGQSTLFTQVTGNPSVDSDGAGVGADDLNPAFSLTQQNIVYFSSKRPGDAGRRIYVVRTDGTGLQRVTDPTLRPGADATDEDDYPALSLDGAGENSGELLAFQSNSLIDASDTTKDRNIWALGVNSRSIGSVPVNPSPKFFVSSFNGNQVYFVNPPVGTTPASLFNVESGSNLIPSPEGLVYYQNYVYVSSRTRNRVERLDAETGEARPGYGAIGAAFTPNEKVGTTTPTGIEVPSPSGLAIKDSSLYVVSGSDLKTAVYKYDSYFGAPNGIFVPKTTTTAAYTSARFTFGEPESSPLADAATATVSEGIAINKAGTRMYVSNYAKDRINIYTLVTFIASVGDKFNETGTTSKTFTPGQWLGEIKAPQLTSNVLDPERPANKPDQKEELLKPTGVAIGPDIDGDGQDDLYVCSSANNDILAFSLDTDGAAKPLADDSQFKIVTSDNAAGSKSRLLAPEGIRFDSTGTTMYVSSYTGSSINRYTRGDNDPATNDVDYNTPWVPAGLNGSSTSAVWFNIQGPAYFDFNTLFAANYNDINGGVVGGSNFIGEQSGSAYVVSNILSSPANLASSDLSRPVYNASGGALPVNVTEDKSADIEANFGRDDASDSSLQNRVRIIFSSNRRFAASPASNAAGATASNPNGGADSQIPSDITQAPVKPANCDLWITVSADLEAPIIQPEQNNYPMLSPTHESGNFSSNPDIGPRTARGGLAAGKPVKFALLAKEKESGLKQVSFAFYNPEDRRRFVQSGPGGNYINDNKLGVTLRETSPSGWPAVSGFGFDDAGMSLDLVDDFGNPTTPTSGNYYSDQGPRGTSPERQSNAVAGDGIYYLAKSINAPSTPGDYYVSVRLTDRSGNDSYYYFIWGFTTANFSPSTSNDLFVSDNTAGQEVRINNRGLTETGFGAEDRNRLNAPVESFYLSNWGPNTNSVLPFTAGAIGDVKDGVLIPSAISDPVTLGDVDVWRILCRGPIDEDIVSTNYIPSTVTQINPDKFTNGFQIKDKVFANVQRAVLWAAPYAGTAEVEFDIPGSIKEGATKQQLKRLLAGGGRLFLTGRNILTALDEGGADNSFRSEELYATKNGKVAGSPLIATAVLPLSGTNAFPEVDNNGNPRAAYSDLQFAWTPGSAPNPPDYRDASYSHNGDPADTYTPGASSSSVQIFPAYTASGKPFGQRIIKKRSTNIDSGLESRVVFFPFNFDGVNRRFKTNGDEALNVRADITNGIRTWFKTGTFNGTVVDNTGALVANALVAVQSGSDLYYARTDVNGFYELKGLPAGRGYSAFFVFNDATFDTVSDGVDGDANDRDDLPIGDVNRNYFTGTGAAGYVVAGGTSSGNEIRVQKVGTGSVVGKVYTYAGNEPTDNPLNRSLHTPIGDIQVMLTVPPTTPASPNPYARVVTTTATGDFTFADAPSGQKLLLILNPKTSDIPAGSDLTDPNDPNFVSVKYNQEYGRRVIPVNNDKRRQGDITATQNDVFVVNDTYKYDSTKTELSSYIDPPVDTKADEKDANGVSLPVVLTRGEPISGKFTFVAGNDTPKVGAGWTVQLVPVPVNGVTTGTARQTVTKADGTYTFDEVLNGTYKLVGTVPKELVNGYDQLTAQTASFNTLLLTDAQKAAVNLTAKIAHIAGSVKVNGQYVSGATVTLKNTNGTPVVLGPDSTPRKSTSGNVSGSANYFIGYVPVGNYKLTAQLPNNGESKTVDVAIDANTTVKVVDFTFFSSVIKINVTTAYAGLGRDGVTVQAIKNGASSASQTGTTDANGDVTFTALADGIYTFKATKTILGVTSTATSNNVTVTQASLPGVTIPLKWDSVGGTVKLNNVAYAGAKIQFFLGNTEVTDLAVTSASNGTYQAGKNAGSTIARPLAAGSYTIRASITSNGFTLSQDQTKVITSPFLGQIITLPDFNFVESYVTGVVRFNGTPTSGFQVQLLNSDNTLFKDSDGLGRTATTDANGTYRFNSVTIGKTGLKVKATKTIGAYLAEGSANLPTIANGVTQAPVIDINKAGGISGVVRVNGEPAVGANVEVLDKKKKSLSPAVVVTVDANGKYFIIGLPETSASVSYTLQASYTENGNVLKPLTKSFKVKGSTYTPASANFDFKVTRVKGLVRANGSPAVGAAITLLDKKGAALKVPITGTTDANGNYLLSGVKSGTYRVQASYVGVTGYADVKVGNLKTTVAPTIDLTPQELQVTTEFRASNTGAKIGDAPGATVEILSTSGNSMGTGYTKITDANSKATFLGLAVGSYRARITLQGYSTTTTFSVTAGLSTRVLPITLSQPKDLLLISESDKLRTTELGGIDIIRVSLLTKPTQDVQVKLVANLPTEARFSTGTTVTLTFTKTNWNVEQLVTVVGQADNITDGDKAFTITGSVTTGDSLYAQISNFTLNGVNFENATIPTTGPTYAANTKTLVSTPFADVSGKITVAETFGTTGFTLYRFNAAGQKRLNVFTGVTPGADWVAMTGSDYLERGRGYLLVTGAAPVTMLIPAAPTIFSGDSFAVDVVRNPNFEAETGDNNVNNGYDLVGFPFDPSTVSGVDILQQAQVLADGVLYSSFLEAAGAGKVSNRIYTVDSLGRPIELTPANSTVKPYRGYFVKVFTDKVKIILKATPSNSAGSSGTGTSSSSSAAKSSIKAS